MKRLHQARESSTEEPGIAADVETEEQADARSEEMMRREARKCIQASVVGLGQVTMLQVSTLRETVSDNPQTALVLMGSSFVLAGQLQRLAAIYGTSFTPPPPPRPPEERPAKIEVTLDIVGGTVDGAGQPVGPAPLGPPDAPDTGQAVELPTGVAPYVPTSEDAARDAIRQIFDCLDGMYPDGAGPVDDDPNAV